MTLIDLLVQVVFVFTLLLIASGAFTKDGENPAIVPPEVWKTLVSIFVVDEKLPPERQAEMIKQQFEDAKHELAKLKQRLTEQDRELAQLRQKFSGGSGLPICRSTDGTEIVALDAYIDREGLISVSVGPHAEHMPSHETVARAVGRKMTGLQFRAEFIGLTQQGRNMSPPCQYAAILEFDPRSVSGDFNPSRQAVASIFWIKNYRAGARE